MFLKKKKNRSGTVSVVVAEKISGKYSELTTIGVSSDESDIEQLIIKGKGRHKMPRGCIVIKVYDTVPSLNGVLSPSSREKSALKPD